MRDFDLPDFKFKKCGLWGMLRYFGVIRTAKYLYWCWKFKRLKDKKWVEGFE